MRDSSDVQLTGKYNSTPPTLSNGQGGDIQLDSTGGLVTNPKALNKTDDSITNHIAPANSKVGITASAQLLSGPGVLLGFSIVSHTAGATVRFSDALTATTPYVSSAFTTVAGHIAGNTILFGTGITMATGCYVTIAGTIEIIPLVKLN